MSTTIMPETESKAADSVRFKDHTFYKPNKRGTGAAIRLNLNEEKRAIFVEGAAQSGERQFDWENKIIMKWGVPDLGALLATVRGRQGAAKLFHKTEAGNSAVELSPGSDPERPPYMLGISRQLEADKSVRKVAIPLTHGEAVIFEKLLEIALDRILRW